VRIAAERISDRRHTGVDWAEFVDRWRAEYFTALTAANNAWTAVHLVYRDALDRLLGEYGITGFTTRERDELTFAWQRLTPWPDTVPGLTRLKSRFVIAALSNADVAAVVNISKSGALPWDAVFSAEMAGAFKPDPVVYQMAARYLGFKPAEIMMVACHKYDIRAAGALGFQTAFVTRPLEFGVGGEVDVSDGDEFDINARDFRDLATRLGC
jgi:2-haloacid dehalogenase